MRAVDSDGGGVVSRVSRNATAGLADFAKRLMIALLFGAFALTLWKLADLLILLFAAILMAIGLRAAAVTLSRSAHIGVIPALGVATGALLAAVAAALWFFGTVVADQVPFGIEMLIERLQSHPYGRIILEQARVASVGGAASGLATWLASIARAIARGLGYGILTFFVALYLAAQPARYHQMCLRILPDAYRSLMNRFFERTADILRRWLLGQLVVMAAIGTLSGVGLWLLGIKAAFALGLVGGLLTFIPYVGAVLAAVPATLVALTQGPTYAGVVVLMFVGIHIIEGNFITPFVQAEATSLPPVLALLSTLAFSLLFGVSAVLLAAPLTLFAMTAIETLWVEQVLSPRTSGHR